MGKRPLEPNGCASRVSASLRPTHGPRTRQNAITTIPTTAKRRRQVGAVSTSIAVSTAVSTTWSERMNVPSASSAAASAVQRPQLPSERVACSAQTVAATPSEIAIASVRTTVENESSGR